jgi:hypothetical protein
LVGLGFWAYPTGVPNDSMSSIKVGSDVRLTLCRDAVYGGTCETFPARRACLIDMGNVTR